MISTNDRKTIIAISGAQTEFEFDFYIISEEHLEVYHTDADGYDWKLVKDTDFTVQDVDGDDFADGGQITVIYPPAGYSTGYITIIGHADRDQDIDFINNQAIDRQVYEASLDKLTILVQELQAKLDRAVLMPQIEEGQQIPPKSERANNWLGFNSLGEIVAAKYVESAVPATPFAQTLLGDSTASEALSTLGVSTFIQTLLDDTTAAAALATLGVSTFIQTLLDDADAETARTTLGVDGGGFISNEQTITSEPTFEAGKNYLTVGPIEIADGVTIDIPDGVTWVVV